LYARAVEVEVRWRWRYVCEEAVGMRLDAGGAQNGGRTRRCSLFPFVTYSLTRTSPVRHGFVNPYNFLNPLNTDFNP
jgi:hypothetical protein